MSKELASRATDKLSGGDNNYWLVEIIDRTGQSIVAEAEDIIEHLRMPFEMATVFKSVWRLCKLRQGLGKPGSSMLYEAQKVKYSAVRAEVLVGLHNTTFIKKIARSFFNLLLFENIFAPVADIIVITHPKRLEPYKFDIDDFVAAMNPTTFEREVFLNVLRLAQYYHHPRPHERQQWLHATALASFGSQLEKREQIAAERAAAP